MYSIGLDISKSTISIYIPINNQEKGSGDNNNPKPNLPTEPYFQIIIAKVFLQTFLLIIT